MMWHLSRRRLLATIIGGWAAQPGSLATLPALLTGSLAANFASEPLAAMCANLCCPETMQSACLRALPPEEASLGSLIALISATIRLTRNDRKSADAVLGAARDQIRSEFGNGTIAIVDGWILSVTEMRLYALSGQLSNEKRA